MAGKTDAERLAKAEADAVLAAKRAEVVRKLAAAAQKKSGPSSLSDAERKSLQLTKEVRQRQRIPVAPEAPSLPTPGGQPGTYRTEQRRANLDPSAKVIQGTVQQRIQQFQQKADALLAEVQRTKAQLSQKKIPAHAKVAVDNALKELRAELVDINKQLQAKQEELNTSERTKTVLAGRLQTTNDEIRKHSNEQSELIQAFATLTSKLGDMNRNVNGLIQDLNRKVGV